MKIFIDCEFNGYQGKLISMALVPEDQSIEPFYQELDPWDISYIDHHERSAWVYNNVVTQLDGNPVSETEFSHRLQRYLSKFGVIEIIADWPDDIKYFCDAIITGPGTAMITPRSIRFEVIRIDASSKKPHHALYDAIAIRDLYLVDC